MVPEAKLTATENGLVPEGEGWFVLNAREAAWKGGTGLGAAVTFEGDARFPSYGVNIQVLNPGEPNCMYHGEEDQEDFLVLTGECILIVEGEERPLHAWDFVHCPPYAEHVFVGAGDEPCAILMIGGRLGSGLIYPANETALRHGAGVQETTPDPKVAYAFHPGDPPIPYRDGDLPDWDYSARR
jgi:uncharacterized cupin superfamily protein